MHQTGKICRNKIFSFCSKSILYFLFPHSNRNRFELHSKSSTKTAAGLYVIQFNQLKTFYVCKKFSRLLFYFTFTQACTTIVVSSFPFQFCPDIVYLQYFHHEL